jgi:hypothetical protein
MGEGKAVTSTRSRERIAAFACIRVQREPITTKRFPPVARADHRYCPWVVLTVPLVPANWQAARLIFAMQRLLAREPGHKTL